MELELERVLLERSDVHEALSKAESLAAAFDHDKKRLLDECRRVSIVINRHKYSICLPLIESSVTEVPHYYCLRVKVLLNVSIN